MTPRRRRMAALVIAGAVVVGGCGDGGDDDVAPVEPEVGEDDAEVVPGEDGPVD